MRKFLLVLGCVVSAQAKIGVWVSGGAALGLLTNPKNKIDMFFFLKDSSWSEEVGQKFTEKHGAKSLEDLKKEFSVHSDDNRVTSAANLVHDAIFCPAYLHDNSGNPFFHSSDSSKELDSETLVRSGSYKLVFGFGNIELIKVKQSVFGLEVGLGYSFGNVKEESKYAVIEKSINFPIFTFGPTFEYKFTREFSVDFGVFGAIYEDVYRTYLQRADLTDAKLDGLSNISLHKDVSAVYKSQHSNFTGSVTQKYMSESLKDLFGIMSEGNKDKNKFETGLLTSFGAGMALNWRINEDLVAKFGVRYIFPRSVSSKEGQKMNLAHFLVESGNNDNNGTSVPQKAVMKRTGMLIVSLCLSYRIA